METITDRFEISNPYLQRMHAEADNIQSYINETAHLEDPTSLTIRLNVLDAYMARLSDMLVRAKAMKEKAQNLYLKKNEEQISKMSATASNRQINAHLYEYTTTYNRIDTMYHTVEHLSKDLVTQISYIKQQMAYNL